MRRFCKKTAVRLPSWPTVLRQREHCALAHRTKQNAQRGAAKRPIGSEAIAGVL